ncbi:hypothetical protein Tco_1348243, partial [Tanacetum coccineum]
KGLVEIFDKLENGQLNEGLALQHLVKHLHNNRQGAPRKREGSPDGIKGRARFRYEESFYQNPLGYGSLPKEKEKDDLLLRKQNARITFTIELYAFPNHRDLPTTN